MKKGDLSSSSSENVWNILFDRKNNNIYIVKKGDSLYSISRKYGITVDELMSLNNLNSTLLSIGQKLIIK